MRVPKPALAWFQLTAARRRLDAFRLNRRCDRLGFNSQPPGGGWTTSSRCNSASVMFQLTAARRRLGLLLDIEISKIGVSTHSRPEAAG